MILKALGFYTGKCDGIWSKLTIDAKKEFEADPKFKPAYPNNGMPFELGVASKLPQGLYMDPRRPGFIMSDDLNTDRVNEWGKDLVEDYDNRRDTAITGTTSQEPSEDVDTVEQDPVMEQDQLDPSTTSTKEAQINTNNSHGPMRKKKHRK